jgi:hypothetical protein
VVPVHNIPSLVQLADDGVGESCKLKNGRKTLLMDGEGLTATSIRWVEQERQEQKNGQQKT